MNRRSLPLLLVLALTVAAGASAQEPAPAPPPPDEHAGHRHDPPPAETPAPAPAPAHPRDATGHLQHPAAGASAGEQDLTAGAALRLADLERRALDRHPALERARAAIAAAEGRREQAGRWPNPEVGLVGEELGLEDDGEAGKYGGLLSQRFVLGGKLARARAVRDAQLEQARTRAEAARLATLTRVRTAYYHALAAQQGVAVTERLATLAAEAVDVTDQLFNTGAADLPDRLAAQIEARRSSLELTGARRELEAAWRALEGAVGPDRLEPGPLEDVFAGPLPALDRDATRRVILEQSPALALARLEVERADAVLARERRIKVPDLEVEVGLLDNQEPVAPGGPRLGSEAFAEARISLPLFDRNRGQIAAAEAEQRAARAGVEQARLDLEARFAEAFAGYASAAEAAAAYRNEILPAARESYDLYLASYQQMTAAYPQVLVAQRTLFQAEADALAALVELWDAAARLEGRLVTEGDGPGAAGTLGGSGGDDE
ncbi:MAG TPA: TolC family protein [Thermoanaerobaculia bacterium]|nr:TolC family protein [Thermoanaerobaculia bacterium]